MLTRLTICLLLFILPYKFYAQDDFAIVQKITLKGNKKTKEQIIYKELNVFPGDTLFLSNMALVLENNEKRILNTGLFTWVNINIKSWDTEKQTLNLEIVLQENWYIYPGIIFELADRNFNVWWQEQNRSFDRVNYGLRIDHINFTGNKDYLKAKVQFGYTRKYEIRYERPYLTDNWGYSANVFFSDNKEIGYKTVGNKTIFEKTEDEKVLLKRFRIGTAINYRPTPFIFQTLHIEFHRNSIDTFVANTLNPDYFLDNKTNITFFLLNYNIQYDQREYFLYPEGGYRLFGSIKKEGLGLFRDINYLSLEIGAEKYFKLAERVIWGSKIKGRSNLNRNQIAFANNTGLGYGGNVITGYELYVIDGTDFVLAKSSLTFNFLKKLYNIDESMPLRQFKKMSFNAYLRFNLDWGYVNEPSYFKNNELNNQWLLGYGPALDFIFYNNFLLSFEYSFNELGESGFFIQSYINF